MKRRLLIIAVALLLLAVVVSALAVVGGGDPLWVIVLIIVSVFLGIVLVPFARKVERGEAKRMAKRIAQRAAQACDIAMKRRLLIIGICLLLAAVLLNGIVAISCTFWPYGENWTDPYSIVGLPDARPNPPSVERVLATHRPSHFTYPDGVRHGLTRFGYDLYVIREWPLDSKNEQLITSAVFAGWPMKAFWGYRGASFRISDPPSNNRNLLSEWHTGVLRISGNRWIPVLPIWLGFTINTIFYAALLWLLILGPFALRRLLRVRRALCPKCAYPVGESSVCSECGE